MASSNLLSSELAKRKSEVCGTGINHKLSTYDDTEGAIVMQKSCKSQSELKMVLYQSSQQLDQINPPRIESCRTLALDNIFHHEVEENSKMGTHMSNPSSLVTSLSSSSEDSQDKTNLPILFGMPSTAASRLLATIPTSNVNFWELPAHLRPPLSFPQIPVFAAWTDA